MKKMEAREIARNVLATTIGVAYYRISDVEDYTEKEKELIIEQLNKLSEKACKAIGMEYIAY